MKKFVKNIFIFSTVVFSIFGLITIITNLGLRKTENLTFKEWNEVFDGKINSDLIVQGSSRAWVQFNTFILDSALHTNSYNLGIDGSQFDVQYLRYVSYITNNKAPKVILQNVDWDTMNKNKTVFQKCQFLPYIDEPEFKNILISDNLLPKSDIYLPFLRYSGQMKSIMTGFAETGGIKHFESYKHKGYAGATKQWNGDNFEMRKKQGNIQWIINKDLEKQFFSFLADCQQRKIKVILVFAPVYYELVDYIPQYNLILLYYKEIAEKNNIGFLDYSLDSISYNKNYFYNATHLNKKGSELFTKRLTEQMKKMNVMGNIKTKK